MPTVKFTGHLKRFYPDLDITIISALTIPDILDELNGKYPKIKNYVVDEQGQLRKHVNIFIGDELIKDRKALSDSIEPGDQIYIMQALSGG